MSSSLLTLLQSHVPEDAREREDRERMLDFASRLKQPFSRTEAEAHFTGSALVTDPSGQRVLMLHHAKLQRWLQPGGHSEVEDGGDLLATALREAREETGCDVSLHSLAPRPLDVDIHRIPARKTEPEHLHLDVRYLFVANDPEALAFDAQESTGAQWLSWDVALARADEAPLRRLLAKGKAFSRDAAIAR